MNTNVALVVGVTGIVGNSLVETLLRPDASGAPWRVIGVARRSKPEWLDAPVDYIQCDLLDKSDCTSKLPASQLSQVTHVFWVTWATGATEEENCQSNTLMLNTLLQILLPLAKNLKHICLQTGAKHYLGSHFTFGTFEHYEPPFEEDMPRLPRLNFYYALEDVVHETCRLNPAVTWSVHRPNIIFGFAPRNQANVLGSLAIYATICKHQGLSFRFPGSQRAWETLTNVSDGNLIAEQEVWAATHPQGENQAFNVDNGDLITWKRLWSLLAREFNLELPAYSGEPTNVGELMADKGEAWQEIVREHGLIETPLQAETWWAVDLCLNFPFQLVTSMNKSKEAGFIGFRNTAKSTQYWIRKMKGKKVIPDDDFWTK